MCAISKYVAGAAFVALSVFVGADAALSARQMPDFDWQTFTIADFGTRSNIPRACSTSPKESRRRAWASASARWTDARC
jgi:hypothetical protein